MGGPTRPGVSLSAPYQAAFPFRWWLYMLHTTSRPSRPMYRYLALGENTSASTGR